MSSCSCKCNCSYSCTLLERNSSDDNEVKELACEVALRMGVMSGMSLTPDSFTRPQDRS